MTFLAAGTREQKVQTTLVESFHQSFKNGIFPLIEKQEFNIENVKKLDLIVKSELNRLEKAQKSSYHKTYKKSLLGLAKKINTYLISSDILSNIFNLSMISKEESLRKAMDSFVCKLINYYIEKEKIFSLEDRSLKKINNNSLNNSESLAFVWLNLLRSNIVLGNFIENMSNEQKYKYNKSFQKLSSLKSDSNNKIKSLEVDFRSTKLMKSELLPYSIFNIKQSKEIEKLKRIFESSWKKLFYSISEEVNDLGSEIDKFEIKLKEKSVDLISVLNDNEIVFKKLLEINKNYKRISNAVNQGITIAKLFKTANYIKIKEEEIALYINNIFIKSNYSIINCIIQNDNNAIQKELEEMTEKCKLKITKDFLEPDKKEGFEDFLKQKVLFSIKSNCLKPSFTSPSKNYLQKIANYLIKSISSLKPKDYLLVPAGIQDNTILIEIYCEEKDNYSVSIFNTGFGSDFHKKAENNAILPIKITNLKLKDVREKSFIEKIVKYKLEDFDRLDEECLEGAIEKFYFHISLLESSGKLISEEVLPYQKQPCYLTELSSIKVWLQSRLDKDQKDEYKKHYYPLLRNMLEESLNSLKDGLRKINIIKDFLIETEIEKNVKAIEENPDYIKVNELLKICCWVEEMGYFKKEGSVIF